MITSREVEISERYLSEDERVTIAELPAGIVRNRLAAARRRSAGSCDATEIPSAASTGRLWRRSWPWTGGPDLAAGRHTADAVRDAVVAAMSVVPAHLRRSLTWDQGKEMALHAEMPSSWTCRCSSARRPRRGSGRRLRTRTGCCATTSPKAPGLRVHDADRLAEVETEVNDRPRNTLDWATPAVLFDHLPNGAPPRPDEV